MDFFNNFHSQHSLHPSLTSLRRHCNNDEVFVDVIVTLERRRRRFRRHVGCQGDSRVKVAQNLVHGMPESFVGEADTASVQISFFSSSSSSSSSNKYLQEENQTRERERERFLTCARHLVKKHSQLL